MLLYYFGKTDYWLGWILEWSYLRLLLVTVDTNRTVCEGHFFFLFFFFLFMLLCLFIPMVFEKFRK